MNIDIYVKQFKVLPYTLVQSLVYQWFLSWLLHK